MNLYLIRRRYAWKTPEELQETAARSRRIGDEEMSSDIRWIRSYVVHEPDGTLGTLCVYEATSAAAIEDHARRVGMPADEITPVVDTVVVRPDPARVDAAA